MKTYANGSLQNGHRSGGITEQCFTWEDVGKHTHNDDKWIVVNGKVYDITTFSKRHPGGAKVISHFSGQDATDAWTGFHNDKEYVSKFLRPLCIGYIQDNTVPESLQDFRNLRKTVEDMGWLNAQPLFYFLHLLLIVTCEVLSYYVANAYGMATWLPYMTVVVLLVTAQAQAGWSQHDYGHLSVFKSRKLNHLAHSFIIGHMKGVSSHWWNFRHFQHHAKPNVVIKDPDVTLPSVFLLGDKLPQQWARARRGIMPYQWQHQYFFLIGPPLLLPLYFHFENVYFVIKRRNWYDFLWSVTFFIRYFYLWGGLLGGLDAFKLYMFIRFIESHWFTWCTQMSHISMDVDRDVNDDWLKQQLKASCNVNSNLFIDWFTGHLNYQIEHHLFPTMPRHNFVKVAPLVRSLCKKHGIEYTQKTLIQAWCDVIRSLKHSGELWYEAYHNPG